MTGSPAPGSAAAPADNPAPAMEPPELSEADAAIMGSPEAAALALELRTKEWRELRQLFMGTASAHKAREAKEREARFQVANAAMHWLWHQERRAASGSLPGEQGKVSLHPATALNLLDAEAEAWWKDADVSAFVEGIRANPTAERMEGFARQCFVEGAYRGAIRANSASSDASRSLPGGGVREGLLSDLALVSENLRAEEGEQESTFRHSGEAYAGIIDEARAALSAPPPPAAKPASGDWVVVNLAHRRMHALAYNASEAHGHIPLSSYSADLRILLAHYVELLTAEANRPAPQPGGAEAKELRAWAIDMVAAATGLSVERIGAGSPMMQEIEAALARPPKSALTDEVDRLKAALLQRTADIAAAQPDPKMPRLSARAIEQLDGLADASHGLADDDEERLDATALEMLVAWQRAALAPPLGDAQEAK